MAYLDGDGLLYFWEKLKAYFVKQETGKGLSTNDFTTDEKTKLANLANYTLPIASTTILGGIKIGDNLTITSDGTISAVQGAYTLPTASSTTLGGIKVGTNLSISNGVLSAVDTTYSTATTSANGLMSSADKSKLDGIATGAQVNVLEAVKLNGTALTISGKAVNVDLSSYALSSTTLAGYGITNAYTKTEIDSKLSSTYKAAGSSAFADLPTPAESVLGYVYNVTDTFTTTASFIEGAGKTYPAGTNVAVIVSGGTYYYDVLPGFVDLSGYLLIASTITNTTIDTIVAS